MLAGVPEVPVQGARDGEQRHVGSRRLTRQICLMIRAGVVYAIRARTRAQIHNAQIARPRPHRTRGGAGGRRRRNRRSGVDRPPGWPLPNRCSGVVTRVGGTAWRSRPPSRSAERRSSGAAGGGPPNTGLGFVVSGAHATGTSAVAPKREAFPTLPTLPSLRPSSLPGRVGGWECLRRSQSPPICLNQTAPRGRHGR
jgi:hypothetical protein